MPDEDRAGRLTANILVPQRVVEKVERCGVSRPALVAVDFYQQIVKKRPLPGLGGVSVSYHPCHRHFLCHRYYGYI
ncbi:MAG: hypothetical protein ABSA16_17765 [Thermoguttaceae bacterium]